MKFEVGQLVRISDVVVPRKYRNTIAVVNRTWPGFNEQMVEVISLEDLALLGYGSIHYEVIDV